MMLFLIHLVYFFYDNKIVYIEDSKTWETVNASGTKPCARYGHSAVVTDNKMFVLFIYYYFV
jgi:RNA:NAD 2'-phosphotransferase (TPT1/KptA family)